MGTQIRGIDIKGHWNGQIFFFYSSISHSIQLKTRTALIEQRVTEINIFEGEKKKKVKYREI